MPSPARGGRKLDLRVSLLSVGMVAVGLPLLLIESALLCDIALWLWNLALWLWTIPTRLWEMLPWVGGGSVSSGGDCSRACGNYFPNFHRDRRHRADSFGSSPVAGEFLYADDAGLAVMAATQ